LRSWLLELASLSASQRVQPSVQVGRVGNNDDDDGGVMMMKEVRCNAMSLIHVQSHHSLLQLLAPVLLLALAESGSGSASASASAALAEALVDCEPLSQRYCSCPSLGHCC